jgi:hypothetical protein
VTVAEPELTPIAEKAADRAPAAMLTVAGTVTAPEEESTQEELAQRWVSYEDPIDIGPLRIPQDRPLVRLTDDVR